MDEGLGADRGLDVFYLSEQPLFGLVEDASVVRYLCLCLLGEVADLDLGLLLDFHEVLFDLLDLGLIFGDFFLQLLLLQVLLVLDPLDLHVQVLLLLQQLPQLVLVLQLMGDERAELLRVVVLYELGLITTLVLSSSSFVISDLRSRVTLNESRSRSGLSLNSLHNFFVLSFKIIDRFAISISISSSST